MLLALADPIAWEYVSPPSGASRWQGEYAGISYVIHEPSSPEEPDAAERERLWSIVLMPRHFGCYARTLDAAKALCSRHALTNDLGEMEALRASAKAEEAWFKDTERTTLDHLEHILKQGRNRKIRFLPWNPPHSYGVLPMRFAASGPQGSYAARWEPERRWIVTFTPGYDSEADTDTRIVEKQFLTRQIVRMACAIHSHTGNWAGVLKEIPRPL